MSAEAFSDIQGVILAAGLSSRMGGAPKALLTLEGRSLLERALAALRRGGAREVVAVTGHRFDEVEAEARRLGLPCVRNADYLKGMFSSVRTGLGHLARKARQEGRELGGALFILPVDAGLVWEQSPAALAKAWSSLDPAARQGALLLPCFAGRCGHPPLIGAAHVPGILGCDDEGGLRGYMASLFPGAARECFLQGRVPAGIPLPAEGPFQLFDAGAGGRGPFFLPLPDAGLLSDLDEPQDLDAAAAFLARTEGRRDFTPEEAWEWLRHANLGEQKTRHCLLVGLGALRLGLALERAGLPVDPALHLCGGLLHDIARRHKEHAGQARRWIAAWGRPLCALVAGAHTALPDALLEALGIVLRDVPEARAATLRHDSDEAGPYAAPAPALLYACVSVYLADKYSLHDAQVPMPERFEAIKRRVAPDTAALARISRRESIAGAVAAWFKNAAGESPEALVGRAAGHPLEDLCERLLAGEKFW